MKTRPAVHVMSVLARDRINELQEWAYVKATQVAQVWNQYNPPYSNFAMARVLGMLSGVASDLSNVLNSWHAAGDIELILQATVADLVVLADFEYNKIKYRVYIEARGFGTVTRMSEFQ
jgi:hypothetical protein